MVKCIDMVNMAIDGMNEKLPDEFELDTDRYEVIKSYCDVIDKLEDECTIYGYAVEVDEENGNVCIAVECTDISLSDMKHPFFDVVQDTVIVQFTMTEDFNLVISFVFSGLIRF